MPNTSWAEFESYSSDQRELEMFKTLNKIQNDVREVKVQTQRTNGRVNKLELWRSMIVGALIIVGILLPYLEFIK